LVLSPGHHGYTAYKAEQLGRWRPLRQGHAADHAADHAAEIEASQPALTASGHWDVPPRRRCD